MKPRFNVHVSLRGEEIKAQSEVGPHTSSHNWQGYNVPGTRIAPRPAPRYGAVLRGVVKEVAYEDRDVVVGKASDVDGMSAGTSVCGYCHEHVPPAA